MATGSRIRLPSLQAGQGLGQAPDQRRGAELRDAAEWPGRKRERRTVTHYENLCCLLERSIFTPRLLLQLAHEIECAEADVVGCKSGKQRARVAAACGKGKEILKKANQMREEDDG